MLRRRRYVAPLLIVIVVAGGAALATAQTTRPSTRPGSSLPRTPDGHPDLQGVWDFRTATPLERPRELGDRRFFTAEEAAAFEQRNADRIGATIAVHPPEWLDYGMTLLKDLRSSLVTDPPDGRIPELTPAGRAAQQARAAARRAAGLDGPESMTLGERCLIFSAGPPLVPGPYNNNLRIVQTPAAVVLETEMIHDARIVRADARAPLPSGIRPWLGDSRGRWDGDTFVVETTHFSERTPFRNSDPQMRLTERFSLDDANTLRYAFTVDNPTAFTRPWTVSFPMVRSTERMYEYACHEGNYALVDTLRGERFVERSGANPR
jgi:hypothetical protein